ncbi:MAG TPA: hypothetical protein VFI11_00095 [Anaerolineales bacterium]|nr:hypothetical protein [Anaerolineales bacterium]
MRRQRARFGWVCVFTIIAAACAGPAPTPAGQWQVPAAETMPARATEPSGLSVLVAVQETQTSAYRFEVVDPATGDSSEASQVIDLEVEGAIGSHAFSPDGSLFAFVAGGTSFCEPYAGGNACWGGSDHLFVLDLEDGSTSSIGLPTPGRVSSMVFNPAGNELALAFHDRRGSHILAVDTHTTAIRAETDLSFDPSMCGFTCSSLTYTRDGQGLLVFGADPGEKPGISPPGPAQVALLEAESLETLWSSQLDGLVLGSWCIEGCDASHEFYVGAHWYPAVVWQASADRLLAFHAEADRLSTIDVARRLVQSVDLVETQTWLDRLMAWGALSAEAKGASQGTERRAVLAPDGSRVFTLGTTYHATPNSDGTWDMWTEPLGLDIVDPASGIRMAHVDTQASDLALTADGRWLLLIHWLASGTISEVVDAATLETRSSFPGWSLQTGRSLEGRSVIMAYVDMETSTSFALVDGRSLELQPKWAEDVILFLR